MLMTNKFLNVCYFLEKKFFFVKYLCTVPKYYCLIKVLEREFIIKSFKCDGMAGQKNMMFTSQDQDHNIHPTDNCAMVYHGAWSSANCHYSNLNGQ